MLKNTSTCILEDSRILRFFSKNFENFIEVYFVFRGHGNESCILIGC